MQDQPTPQAVDSYTNPKAQDHQHNKLESEDIPTSTEIELQDNYNPVLKDENFKQNQGNFEQNEDENDTGNPKKISKPTNLQSPPTPNSFLFFS